MVTASRQPIVSEDVAHIIDSIKKDMVESHKRQKGILDSLTSSVRRIEKKCKSEKRELSDEEKRRRAAGLLRPLQLSDNLCTFLNLPKGTLMPRTEVVKRIAEYVRANDLKSDQKKNEFDMQKNQYGETLATLLGVDRAKRLTYFSMNTYLNQHLRAVKTTPAGVVTESEPVVAEADMIDSDLNSVSSDA